jgi:hypothetical protein
MVKRIGSVRSRNEELKCILVYELFQGGYVYVGPFLATRGG